MADDSAAKGGPPSLPPRSRKKRQAIVTSATEAFLETGFLGTSMDEIASRAGVSKQTVYKHFPDKESLFTEVVTSTIDQVSRPFFEGISRLPTRESVASDLRDAARRLIQTVMQPHVLQLRRLVIAEVARFPALGRLYFDQAPGRTIAALRSLFEQLAARGVLSVDDPDLAAGHFVWLVISIPLNEVMLGAAPGGYAPAELDAFADAGAAVFLAAYG